MKVHFEVSGGYAGLRLAFQGETETLPDEIASQILELAAQARVLEIKSGEITSDSPGPPDVMSYRLTVLEGGRRNTVACTDVTAPPALRPILGYLRTLAKPVGSAER